MNPAPAEAVAADADWALVFPLHAGEAAADSVLRRWTGTTAPVPCRVVRTVKARALWQRILRAAYDTAEPGVLFVDTINRDNTLCDVEHLTATNPCGEIPLPPYGACDLGSLNLAAAVQLIAYDWRQALGGFALPPTTPQRPAADAAAVAGMLGHLEQALVAVDFLDPAAPKKLMPRLNALFNRAQPTPEEIHILRGVAKAMLQTAERAKR